MTRKRQPPRVVELSEREASMVLSNWPSYGLGAGETFVSFHEVVPRGRGWFEDSLLDGLLRAVHPATTRMASANQGAVVNRMAAVIRVPARRRASRRAK